MSLINGPSYVTLGLAILSVILSLVALIVVSTGLERRQKQDHPGLNERNVTCLDNQHITTSYLRKLCKVESGKCCLTSGNLTKVLAELLHIQADTDHKIDFPTYNPRGFAFSPVSAHKRLLPSVEYTLTLDTVPVFTDQNIALYLDPFIEDPFLEHSRGVEVSKSGIRIVQTGMYYVYSNIRYNPDSSRPCGVYKKQTWEHRIKRERTNGMQGSGVILETTHTCCDTCVREKSTSSTGGVFYLEKDDLLTVDVSGYALIRFDTTASYIGLYIPGAGSPDGQN